MKEISLCEDDAGAELYDIAFGWRRDREADFVEECLRTFASKTTGAVLDLACGSGQFLLEMQNRGYQVAGVDISPQMIRRARQRLKRNCILEVACMSCFALTNAFDMATCWLDSLPYLLTNEEIVQHLHYVAEALKDGGLYLVDMGFDHWADSIWSQRPAHWEPDFSNGWSVSREHLEVYHDGCNGPPCDGMAHICTEYLYFRVADRTMGTVSEYLQTSRKRDLHPQEFAALVMASREFEIVDWFTDEMKLDQMLARKEGRGRGLVLLRRSQSHF